MPSLQDIIDSTLLKQDVIAKLPDIGALRVSGPDAKKFLQGQITCDINTLSAYSGLYGAICNIKGRIITNFYLVQSNEDILMLMAKDLVEKTLLHLKKYAVFFKTELTDAQDDFTIYTKLTSEGAESSQLATTRNNETITLTLGNTPLNIEWLITTSTIEETNKELAALSLLAARPVITLEQSETTLPQWLNMQSTGGISFTKGCYTGQEIVARMQYKGKSKKQLSLITWEGKSETTKELVDEQGKSAGQIFATSQINNTHFAQAILNIDPSDTKQLLLGNEEVTLLPLPYSLDSKK
ncbi:YgfZ/GcvT domain-containing protein [Marinomonas foliarum]|uniref:Folate-binding protein YgfZ n=1 Tax=Marinomonas foliarum TaxID=491950 RepID=A0ABX7IRJ9_9GAMM|nr:folate-binding protein YgfZ [Marinomonas foliarum]QRV24991.1 folate-binding protein YgfZ [Marinomonas foliarum]